jgi:antirestriction protein ArdC
MSKKSNFTPSDKFQIVTDRLVSLLEKGVKPWIKPWKSVGYQNLVTGHQYSGINPLLCAVDCMTQDYSQPYFISFNQAKENGWTVKKGSQSTWIRWGGSYAVENENEQGEKVKEFRSAAKWFNVFNIACIDDSEAEIKTSSFFKSDATPQKHTPDLILENFINSQNAVISHGGDRAFYHPSTDQIRLPELSSFQSLSGYYATAIHELGHWTGHKSRLDRDLSGSFGSQSYAFEELIAELTAAFILNEFNYQAELEHHASYLDNWLQALKNDKKYFFKAANLASKASEFLLPSEEKLAA